MFAKSLMKRGYIVAGHPQELLYLFLCGGDWPVYNFFSIGRVWFDALSRDNVA